MVAIMSSEEIERRIEFIIEQQAHFSADIEQLKEAQKHLTADVQALTGNVNVMQSEMRDGFEKLTTEMREGFENLIIANEVTRKLAEDVARLALQTAQRVTDLESKQ